MDCEFLLCSGGRHPDSPRALLERMALEAAVEDRVLERMRGLRRELTALSIDGEPVDDLLMADGLPLWRFFADPLFTALAADLRRHLFAKEAGVAPSELPLVDDPPAGALGAIPMIYALERKFLRYVRTARRFAARAPCGRIAGSSRILYFAEFETEHLRVIEPVADMVEPEGALVLLRGWSWRGKPMPRPRRWIDLIPSRSGRSATRFRESVDLQRVRDSILRILGLHSSPEAVARTNRLLSLAAISRAHCEAIRLGELLDAHAPQAIFGHHSSGVVSSILDHLASVSGIAFVKILHYDSQLWPTWEDPSASYHTKLLVLTERQRTSLVARGADPKDVVAVGYPSFDAARSPLSSRPDPKGSVTVLWAIQGSGVEIEIGRSLVEAVARNGRLALLVRKHPFGTGAFIGALVRGVGEISSGRTLVEDIDRSDIVVCRSSIVALQAILRGKRVVIVEPRLIVDNNLRSLATERGAALLVTDLERLGEALDAVAGDGPTSARLDAGRAAFAADFLDGRDGRGVSSIGRVAEVLAGLIGNGSGDRSNR